MLDGVIIPLAAAHGDAVIAGQTVLRSRPNEFLSMSSQKRHKVNGCGSSFLFIGKVDVWHLITSKAKRVRRSQKRRTLVVV